MNTLYNLMNEIRNNLYWYNMIDIENVLIDIHFYTWSADGLNITNTVEFDNYAEFEKEAENNKSYQTILYRNIEYMKNDESGLIDYLTIWVG